MTTTPRPTTRRRWLRRIAVFVLSYVVALAAGCMAPAAPFDAAVNLVPAPADAGLDAPETPPTLVVMQHGICRSSWSLWRLERALEAHGYEVLNPSYPSTQGHIEDHAALLERKIEKHLAERAGPEPRICFVGHSMGGLVIRRYLEREKARRPHCCVFIATPHRGAHLATERKDLWAFKLFMGAKAAFQLEPGHPFYDSLGRVPCERVGTIYGGAGDDEGWNDDIPGDDDGTVGVAEAQLPEQTDALRLELGHTRISFAEASIVQVLHFLKHGTFRR